MRTLLVSATVMLLAVLASQPLRAQSTASSCPPVAADSARFGPHTVYRECAVSKPARLRKAVDPEFIAESGLTCVVAQLEFVVNADGQANLASAQVIQTNSPAFATALIATLDKWRFNPAELDKQKVPQLFELSHATRAKDALGRTAYVVGRASSGAQARAQRGVGSAPCDL